MKWLKWTYVGAYVGLIPLSARETLFNPCQKFPGIIEDVQTIIRKVSFSHMKNSPAVKFSYCIVWM